MSKGKIALFLIILIIFIGVLFGGVMIVNKHNDLRDILNKYNITESKYKDIKELGSKGEQEIDRQNITDVDIYYSKEGDFLVLRGNENNSKEKSNKLEPPSVGINLKYIIVKKDSIKEYDYNDILDFIGTAGIYYNEGFNNAKQDTNFDNFIYFNNLEELLDI